MPGLPPGGPTANSSVKIVCGAHHSSIGGAPSILRDAKTARELSVASRMRHSRSRLSGRASVDPDEEVGHVDDRSPLLANRSTL